MPGDPPADVQVLKFGGSTCTGTEDYRRIAAFLEARLARDGGRLVVVMSGPAGLTEHLRGKAHALARSASAEATDALLTLSDTVGMALLRLAVEDLGLRAASLNGFQLGITTDSNFSRARVRGFDRGPLIETLANAEVIVIAGGQGVDGRRRPTWFGKNSSDLSAVAVAAALKLPRCEIFSDVCGVYSADPNLIAGARVLDSVPFDMAIELSLSGAKIIHHGAVAHAQRHGVSIVCRLNRDDYRAGTVISEGGPQPAVVVDRRSVVLDFPDQVAQLTAQMALGAAGVPMIQVKDTGRFRSAVTCGFFDAASYLAGRGIPVQIPDANLVSEFGSDGRVRRHVVGTGEAVGFGQALHDRLYAGGPRKSIA